MVKKLVLLAVALTTVLAAIPVLAAPRSATVAASYQEESSVLTDDAEESAEEAAQTETAIEPVGPLALGDRFEADTFALEIQAADVSTSTQRHGYMEVRVSVAMRNDTAQPLAYSPTGLSGETGYPAIELEDSEGVVYAFDRSDPDLSVAGSSVSSILPGTPAHWTVGFQVPDAQSDEMTVHVVSNGARLASWDLGSEPVDTAGWSGPTDLVQVNVGQTMQWSDDVSVSFNLVYGNACGDPYAVISGGGAFVLVDVENSGVTDAYFPNIQYPAPSFVAVWEDGSSAKLGNVWNWIDTTFEDIAERGDDFTFAESVAISAEEFVPDSLTGEKIVIAPSHAHSFALGFGVPRDSRLVDPTANPVALYASTPSGELWWVDLSDAPEWDAERQFHEVDFATIGDAQRQNLEEQNALVSCGFASPVRSMDTIDGVSDYRLETDIRAPQQEGDEGAIDVGF